MYLKLHITVLAALFIVACRHHQAKTEVAKVPVQPKPASSNASKPGSNYNDTITIAKRSAVFYHPDSLQLRKIESINEKSVFESMAHEFFYQMRNSKIQLNKNWRNVQIIDVKNARYLLFHKTNGESILVDLDTKNDPFGLFLFDPIKEPHFTDMMNIDTELPQYFSK